MANWHVRARRVPDGETVEWWVADGALSRTPVPDARPAPGSWVVEGGLVDAHVHLTFEPHDVFGLPRGSDALIQAGLNAHRARGELIVRDVGSLPGLGPIDGVIGAGPFLAPADHYFPHLYEPTDPRDAPAKAARQIAQGFAWAKVILDFPAPGETPLNARLGYEPAVLEEIAAAVHEAGGRLAMHVMGDRVELAIETGADSIEHGTFAGPDAVREMAARGIAWVPTLTTVAVRHLERIPAPPVRALLERQRATLALAAELGVAVLAGTDEEPHGSVAAEVATLVRYGLPASAAVAGATTRAREYLGAPITGLVTFDENPVEDVTVLARPAATLMRRMRRARP
jgi:imidazolonepropionase-like amidohydrolase